MAESDAYADGLARAINGEVVTDSESDKPEDYVHLQDPLSEEGRVLVKKRRGAIQRRIRRMKNSILTFGNWGGGGESSRDPPE